MSSSFAYNTDAVSTNSSTDSYATGGGISSTGFGGNSSASAFYPGPGAGQCSDQYAKQPSYSAGAHPAFYPSRIGYSHLDPSTMATATAASLLGYPSHQSLSASMSTAIAEENAAVSNYCNSMVPPFYPSQSSMLPQPQYNMMSHYQYALQPSYGFAWMNRPAFPGKLFVPSNTYVCIL